MFEPEMAPTGEDARHASLTANEPWSLGEGRRRGSADYLEPEEERSGVIREAVEKVVPGVRDRVEASEVGRPLTVD